MMKAHYSLVGLGLTFAVQGCTLPGSDNSSFTCPETAIIHGLDRMRVHVPGSDPTDENMVFAAGLGNIQGRCNHTDDVLTISFSLDVSAVSGPKWDGQPAGVDYFVSVIGANDEVIDKTYFHADIPIQRQGAGTVIREAFEQKINDLSRADVGTASVLFGFQLDEYEALRQRKGS